MAAAALARTESRAATTALTIRDADPAQARSTVVRLPPVPSLVESPAAVACMT